MKRATILSIMFLFTLGMTTGIVVTLNENAQAIDQCAWQCMFELDCSNDAGPFCDECPGDYIVYKKSTYTGGPLKCPFVKDPVACWSGTQPCFRAGAYNIVSCLPYAGSDKSERAYLKSEERAFCFARDSNAMICHQCYTLILSLCTGGRQSVRNFNHGGFIS